VGASPQVHDFEPGIAPTGLFWTIPISPSALDVDPGAGRARLRADRLAVPDFHDFFNAISPSPTSRPGHASFDARWDGSGAKSKVRDATFGFAGKFVAGNSTITFTVWDDDAPDLRYTSVADGQTTVSAGAGKERNGVFFSQDQGGGDDDGEIG
jgi:hypothetical protein